MAERKAGSVQVNANNKEEKKEQSKTRGSAHLSCMCLCVACNVDVLQTCIIRHSFGKGYYLDIIGDLLYVSQTLHQHLHGPASV